MRTLVSLICSIALVSAVHAQQEDKNQGQRKKQTQSMQHAAKPSGHTAAGGAANKRMPTAATGGQKPRPGRTSAYQSQKANQKGRTQASMAAHQKQKGKGSETSNAAHETRTAKRNQNKIQSQAGDRSASRTNKTRRQAGGGRYCSYGGQPCG